MHARYVIHDKRKAKYGRPKSLCYMKSCMSPAAVLITAVWVEDTKNWAARQRQVRQPARRCAASERASGWGRAEATLTCVTAENLQLCFIAIRARNTGGRKTLPCLQQSELQSCSSKVGWNAMRRVAAAFHYKSYQPVGQPAAVHTCLVDLSATLT